MDLRDVLNRQQAILADLEAQVRAYETSDILTENRNLKAKVEELTTDNTILTRQVSALKDQNTSLTRALYDHAQKERARYIDQSKERLWIYFNQSRKGELDNLTALEMDIKARITNLIGTMNHARVEASHPLYGKIHAFQEEVYSAIYEVRTKISADKVVLSEGDNLAYDNLMSAPVNPEQIKALSKRHSLERFVGLNLISTIGIILIVIGAIFIGQYTVRHMTDTQRAIGIFVLGGGMLVAGEFFNRRKASVISLVISAGGAAILYVALAFSYFALDALGMLPALGICIAITAIAFYMSTRYKAQVLLIMAFIGGHMPIFAIVMDVDMLSGLMVYFVILNLLVLLVSFKMKWTIPTYIGLGFNAIAVWSVLFLGTEPGANVSTFILTGFIFLAFANYTAVPLIGTYVTKGRFTVADVAVMGINTVISCGTMYVAFSFFGWRDVMGLLALIYSVVYFALAIILWKKFTEADTMRDLAALTGLVFFVLIMPLQLDVMWLSLGWLMQGVALGMYGILKKDNRFKTAGFTIYVLCVVVFLVFDTGDMRWLHFGVRYLSITLGSVALLGAFLYKKTPLKGGYSVFKTLALANVWAYVLYLASHLSDNLDWAYPLAPFYLMIAVQAAASFALAYVFSRIKMIYDDGTGVLVFVLSLTGIIGLFIINWPNILPIVMSEGGTGATLGATMIIIAVSCLGIFSLYDLLRHFFARGVLKQAYIPVIITIYGLVVVTQNVLAHYNVAFTNIWLSVFYIGSALGWIIYGFSKNHMMLRRNGLVLALLAVAKVFALDLTGLSLEQRIMSFFIMGILLVGIGYMYQYFNKKLEIKLELAEPEEV